MVVMSSTPAISGQQEQRISHSHTCTNDSMMMMSHFGHEAIFTLDYTINENQTFDCLMPGTKGHPHWHRPPSQKKCCNFAKV